MGTQAWWGSALLLVVVLGCSGPTLPDESMPEAIPAPASDVPTGAEDGLPTEALVATEDGAATETDATGEAVAATETDATGEGVAATEAAVEGVAATEAAVEGVAATEAAVEGEATGEGEALAEAAAEGGVPVEAATEGEPTATVGAGAVVGEDTLMGIVRGADCETACVALCADVERLACTEAIGKHLKKECKDCTGTCADANLPKYLPHCAKSALTCTDYDTCYGKYEPGGVEGG